MLFVLSACKRREDARTAFYYWKTEVQLNGQQQMLMRKSDAHKLYIRYFDVKWDDVHKHAYPIAVAHLNRLPADVQVIPIVYITNRTFEQMPLSGTDSLAANCTKLLIRLAAQQHITFKTIQVDCDWTLKTKSAYFSFLTALKLKSSCSVEATIRLHQVKYRNLAGVPPVNRGVLMFYNMGKLDADLNQLNSIYNPADAQRYLGNLKNYPLPLDVALPVFSWAIHVRGGRVIQIYEKITEKMINTADFEKVKGSLNAFRALKSFFMTGIYIKQNDIFKLEGTDAKTLEQAGQQLAENMPEDSNRTVIYYELANLNLSTFTAETFHQVSANF